MLSYLRIRNFALVEDLEMEFGPGFNAITGETGAGKSLLLGALNLLLGERAEKNAVRGGASEAVVEAMLKTPSGNSAVAEILEASGLDACEENNLLLRRIIPRNGSGRNIVNGGATTLTVFKRLGEALVDLHGPHEHQSLFSEGPRITMLDAFGGSSRERIAYTKEYGGLNELKRRRTEIAGKDDSAATQMELLAFQAQELEDACLDADEEEKLAAELETAANAQRIRELIDTLNEVLMGDEASAFQALAAAQRILTELKRIYPAVAESDNEIRALAGQLKAVTENMVSGADTVENDPQHLQQLENRLALYFRLKRKYRESVPDLLQRLEQWREQLEQWRDRDGMLNRLNEQIEETGQRLQALGRKLSKKRRAAAEKMAAAVTRQLADLGLAQGKFRVLVEPAEARTLGADRIEYVFAPNIGEPAAPLQAIASSGEISRVMLAVKAVLAEHDSIPVLVFDEIDANLGGEAGHAVGRKLKILARHRQVIGITHLAQVAAHAQTHFAVAKQVSGERTQTRVTRLENKETRTAELARMLGGSEATAAAASRHAEALLRESAE